MNNCRNRKSREKGSSERFSQRERAEKATKSNGYLRNLYRNDRKGKIAGVCAGFADYFDVPVWVARLVFISLVIFTFQMALIAYVAAIFLMDKRSEAARDSNVTDAPPRMFNYHQPVGSRLQSIRDRLQQLDEKVGTMEGYVTSKKYQTNRQFNEL